MTSETENVSEERIETEADVANLDHKPSVFLSASVPALRKFPDEIAQEERDANLRYFNARNELVIRAAVASFVREVVRRDMRIVFGAHPAISPMLLTALRDAARGEVLIFQSRFFEGKFPRSTQSLASWSRGRLLVTDEQDALFVPQNASQAHVDWLKRKESLTFMRRCMVKVPGLKAAVIVGGMDGTEEEARLFRANPQLKNNCYAYGGSGSAASDLLTSAPDDYRGKVELAILKDERSPSLAMYEIFNDFSSISGAGTPPVTPAAPLTPLTGATTLETVS